LATQQAQRERNVNPAEVRTIWRVGDDDGVEVIDQRVLPHRFETLRLTSLDAVFRAIAEMVVRGAPLIGATAAFGIAIQAAADASDAALICAKSRLDAARPTAVNLAWATRRMVDRLLALPLAERRSAAWAMAQRIADDDVAVCSAIGDHGLALLRGVEQQRAGSGRSGPIQVLTHCNAGWLATVAWGTALAPIYKARAAGIDVHVWVDETRPRNQGASLTAWELGAAGVAHTVITDNAGGHLMQHGEVDLVLVGCDRVSARGDVCNKIGTYLKALAARDNGVPFYVAMPVSTLDLSLHDGLREIAIESRAAREVTHVSGLDRDGSVVEVRLTPAGSAAANPAFDVTPARLVTALITEHGLVDADETALLALAGSGAEVPR
jgi:methylthioribose-1-phosphate isomerase